MEPLWEPEDSQALAERALELIVERTSRGVGADGRTFTPLASGASTTLRRSGRMLGSLRAKRTSRGAAVEAGVEYARYIDARRPFMALTERQLGELDRRVEELLEQRERRQR